MGREGGSVWFSRLVPDGKGTIWLDNLMCTGREQRLDQCRFGSAMNANKWGKTNCRHYEDVGVRCGRQTCASIANSSPGIRLVNDQAVA